jgi:hypothetical protein
MLWNLLVQNMREQLGENYNFPSMDPSTPWYEFNSYQECCWSLKRPVRLGSFMRYNDYLKEIGLK